MWGKKPDIGSDTFGIESLKRYISTIFGKELAYFQGTFDVKYYFGVWILHCDMKELYGF